MTVKAISKVDSIRREILRQIQLGNFSRGALLPSERNLAKNFNVSYMTARKGVDKLVGESYLKRIPGKGTFVRSDVSEKKMQKQIGIICPTWESPEVTDFMLYASEAVELNNWLPKPFYSRFWEDKIISDAWESCDALIVIPPGPLDMLPDVLRQKFTSNEKPVVFIGIPAHKLSIDTVIGTSENEIKLAMDILKQAGHSKIAFINQYSVINNQKVHVSSCDYASWRQMITGSLGKTTADELYFGVECPQYALAQRKIYSRLSAAGPDLPFTGLIMSVALVWGALAALHDLGLKVPDDISIVAIGDRQEAEFYRPKLSYIRVPIQQHMTEAVKVIEKRFNDKNISTQFVNIEPEIITGKTIKNI